MGSRNGSWFGDPNPFGSKVCLPNLAVGVVGVEGGSMSAKVPIKILQVEKMFQKNQVCVHHKAPKMEIFDSPEDLDGLYRFIYELLLRYWEEEACRTICIYMDMCK